MVARAWGMPTFGYSGAASFFNERVQISIFSSLGHHRQPGWKALCLYLGLQCCTLTGEFEVMLCETCFWAPFVEDPAQLHAHPCIVDVLLASGMWTLTSATSVDAKYGVLLFLFDLFDSTCFKLQIVWGLVFRQAKEACDSYWLRQVTKEKLDQRVKTGTHVVATSWAEDFDVDSSLGYKTASGRWWTFCERCSMIFR